LFPSFAFLHGYLEQLTEEQLETRSIHPSVRAALVHRDRHPPTFSLASELTPDSADDGPNCSVLSRSRREQCPCITETQTDQFVERLRIPRGHGPKARIRTRCERHGLIIHEGEYALDRTERGSKIMAKVAETVTNRFDVGMHVAARCGEREQRATSLHATREPHSVASTRNRAILELVEQ
jgi:hypothetical protein